MVLSGMCRSSPAILSVCQNVKRVQATVLVFCLKQPPPPHEHSTCMNNCLT